jgi:hypothetical protein
LPAVRYLQKVPIAEKVAEREAERMGFGLEEFGSSS